MEGMETLFGLKCDMYGFLVLYLFSSR